MILARTCLALAAGAVIGLVVAGAGTPEALAAPAVIAPAAIATCGGEPKPDPVQCKAWSCLNGIWTAVAANNGSSCNDGNVCTLNDKCSAGACGGTAALNQPCSDQNACTVGDKCDAAKRCVPGPPAQTDDGNPCTADACDPVSGVSHLPRNTECCVAGVLQVGKACSSGLCACSTSAVCAATSSVTRYCYDKTANMTGRQAYSIGQACSQCP